MAFQGIQKLAAIVFALVQSVFFVVSGIYGPLASVGIVNAILVVFQVCLVHIPKFPLLLRNLSFIYSCLVHPWSCFC